MFQEDDVVKIKFHNKETGVIEQRITSIKKKFVHTKVSGDKVLRFLLYGYTKLYKKEELKDVTQEEYAQFIFQQLQNEIDEQSKVISGSDSGPLSNS